MAIDYGEGRCVHSTLGHSSEAMSGVAFQETLKRSAEWVATGKVTFPAVTAEDLPAGEEAATKTFDTSDITY